MKIRQIKCDIIYFDNEKRGFGIGVLENLICHY